MLAWTRFAAPVIVALSLVPAARAQPTASSPSLEPELEVRRAPVALDGRVLFEVRGVAAFPAEERAALISGRLLQVARDARVTASDVHAEAGAEFTEIRAGDQLIARVVDADARLESVSRAELSLVLVGVVKRAIDEYRAARRPERLWSAAIRALAATAFVFLLCVLILRGGRALDAVILRRYRRQIDSLEEKSFDIVRAERLRGLLRGLSHTLRALLLFALVYLYLDYTLGLFPWTRPIAEQLTGWLVSPLRTMGVAFVAVLPDLIFLAVLAVVVRYLLKLLRLFFDGIGTDRIQFEGFDADWAEPTYKIVRIAVIGFALVVAYPYVPGSGSEAFKGVSIFAGIVFSLGSTSIIANALAGYSLTYRRAFKLGDRVRIGSTVGDVTAIRLQVTHLRTPKNEEVVIPNSMILNTEVTNYSTLARAQGVILHTSVGIGYEVPWRQVEAMLLAAAERTRGVEKEPRPFVLQTVLGDFAVSYQLNVYCRQPQAMAAIYDALHRNIQDAFNEHGVQIMTPNYVADTPEAKVVPRERWFEAPAKPAVPSPPGTDEPDTGRA